MTAARIGPDVSSGEAIRTRRRAAPIRFAIRCESSGPRPGQNHGRTAPGVSKLPDEPISPPRQSSWNTRA
ncbi:MAG TPA: hypothetical protein VFM58_04080 [Solirubrobacteraceae bacterium]|nr:hypothetical protein [Solirubrobacteraceae bacterium]